MQIYSAKALKETFNMKRLNTTKKTKEISNFIPAKIKDTSTPQTTATRATSR